MRDLAGRVAVVTGAASGIGFALAQNFGVEGMKLVLADIEATALEAATATLSAQGVETLSLRCDVSKFGDVQNVADAATARFGKVHIICNNAGVSITGPIFQASLDDWRWVYDVNVWGVIHGIKAFVPLLMAHGEEAHVINVASLAAFNGTGEHAPYCSSKAAVLSMSQALRSEMIGWGTKIGVSVVCPGMVDTAINRSWRNRPAGDAPWSDREFAEDSFMRDSAAFQAAGVQPAQIAELTLDAVRENRFYVFNGERWQDYVRLFLAPILAAEEPPVMTWGRDVRKEKEKVGGDEPSPPNPPSIVLARPNR